MALFLGLSISAEEIIKDRKILERESFLKLSWFSYVNSKIVTLFTISAVQTFLFTIIGNSILEIHGMVLPFWLILFSAACMGNIIGLNISSGLDSVIAIYILIPLILVPQLLLGGAMIHFDDLHKSFTNKTYVPFIGNLMTTRWAYEALAVEQFKKNRFEKIFFVDEKIISNADYKNSFLIPQLQNKLELCMRRKESSIDSLALIQDLKIIRNELNIISMNEEIPPFQYIHLLNAHDFSESLMELAYQYLVRLGISLSEEKEKANERRESEYQHMISELGQEGFVKFKQKYYNKNLADIVLNRNEINKVYQTKKRLVQKKDPIFMEPTSNYGRAHFYAPIKIVNNFKIDTLWYNLLMLWILSGVLYLMLIFDWLRKGIKYMQALNINQRIMHWRKE